MTKEDLTEVQEGFQDWVETFEWSIIISQLHANNDLHFVRIYYQNSPDRVSMCPLTVHIECFQKTGQPPALLVVVLPEGAAEVYTEVK